MEIVPRSGIIRTKAKAITSGHFHIGWATTSIALAKSKDLYPGKPNTP